MQAAVEAARALPFPFMLTARAENFLYGRTDLDDTIRRLQAFEAAGADVLYAPGLYDLATIKTVVSALKKPFNLVMGFADPKPDRAAAIGGRRQTHQRRWRAWPASRWRHSSNARAR